MLEKITCQTHIGPISDYLFVFEGAGPHPAILHSHWHGTMGTNATVVAPSRRWRGRATSCLRLTRRVLARGTAMT